MRFARVRMRGERVRWGVVEGDRVALTGAAPWRRGVLQSAGAAARRVPLDEVKWLPPLAQGSTLYCVARNWAKHAAELGNEVPTEPIWFLKPRACAVGHGAPIALPPGVDRVDYEAEIAVVIGRPLHRPPPQEVRRAVLGVTCFNDVTARDVQRRTGAFAPAKGYATFAPCGPWIETDVNLDDLTVIARVDGEERQRGHTREMLRGIVEVVARIATVTPLRPGDVVATGTPRGVGPLRSGQRVEVAIEGVMALSNPVVAAPGSAVAGR